jgi:hypothetical protein
MTLLTGILKEMEEVTIRIGWEYFLGIIAALIGVAWYSSGRFTALETSMQWVKEILNEIKLSSDNTTRPAFGAQSPINLLPLGEQWLKESGMGEYIEKNNPSLMTLCEEKRETNPYEVQKFIFKAFDDLKFDKANEDKFKKFAFEKGTTMSVIRRVGGIHFRNLCLDEFKMNKEDIDKHDPEKKNDKV